MRILAHVHTFNDADIIDRTIEALQRQTRPVDGILVVDNASSDDTLDQSLVKHTTILRHDINQGTSGAVASGLEFALAEGYDWVWVFDADSIPEPNALEKLLNLYAELPPDAQEKIAFLACLPVNLSDGLPAHGAVFNERGIERTEPAPRQRYYCCHVTIWSGCLYRVAAVCQVGLPDRDYVLDWGEYEYAHRIMRAGYKAIIHQDSILHHNIRGRTSLREIKGRIGPIKITFIDFPPIRCYYLCRNTFYFALHAQVAGGFGILRSQGISILLLTLKFLLRGRSYKENVIACIRGIRDGITGNIAARY